MKRFFETKYPNFFLYKRLLPNHDSMYEALQRYRNARVLNLIHFDIRRKSDVIIILIYRIASSDNCSWQMIRRCNLIVVIGEMQTMHFPMANLLQFVFAKFVNVNWNFDSIIKNILVMTMCYLYSFRSSHSSNSDEFSCQSFFAKFC